LFYAILICLLWLIIVILNLGLLSIYGRNIKSTMNYRLRHFWRSKLWKLEILNRNSLVNIGVHISTISIGYLIRLVKFQIHLYSLRFLFLLIPSHCFVAMFSNCISPSIRSFVLALNLLFSNSSSFCNRFFVNKRLCHLWTAFIN
jgi:hypothetical protein